MVHHRPNAGSWRICAISLTVLSIASVSIAGSASAKANVANTVYNVGVGIADITGPSAEIGMMGYANPAQSARGIHTRLFSRAFVFEESGSRVVYVSADLGMLDQSIKFQVVEKLQSIYGNIYNSKNVLLSGTHTHSGPGGYIQYLLYGITTLGFSPKNFEAVVDGIVQSIERATKNLQPGRLFISSGELLQANINRSPYAYEQNPAEERARYKYNVDKEMVLLRVERIDGVPLGLVNWFPVHPVSMNNTNRHITGDNKGYASMLYEYKMNPESRPGKGKFVAAFASSNLGDVSPNIRGPRCINTGLPCDHVASTCGGYVQNCIAFGPGTNGDMLESTEIIGRRHFEKAVELFEKKSGATPISGTVQHVHQYLDMTNVNVTLDNGSIKTTCPAALGYSFAAGTVDGPGAFDFKQGELTGNAFWDSISGLLNRPTEEQKNCHSPKPILLDVGVLKVPYDWIPSVVETQILRVGSLYIVGIPGELTTMSGRRVREAVAAQIKLLAPNDPEPHVVIAGLSNVYSHYITTEEEYSVQRYEGGSTIYGPHTLRAYQQQYVKLAESMLKGENVGDGPTPPNLLGRQFSLISPILSDGHEPEFPFGTAKKEPDEFYTVGATVTVEFASGHPRNEALREGSFFLVEKENETTKAWDVVATDADWNTKFTWSRPSLLSSHSSILVEWKTDSSTKTGTYRIRNFGYQKPSITATPVPYQGSSINFQIIAATTKDLRNMQQDPELKRRNTLLNIWRKLTRFGIGRKTKA